MQNFNQIFQGVFYWALSFGKMNQLHYIYLILFYPFIFHSIILFTISYSIISFILFQFVSFFGSTINLYLISTQHLKYCHQYFVQISSKLSHFKSYYEVIINWLTIREDLLHTKIPNMYCPILLFFRFFIDFFNFLYFIRDLECVINDSGLKVELSYSGYLLD